MRGADGDREIRIAGIGDAQVAIARLDQTARADKGRIPAIAGRHHDGDATADQPVYFNAERTLAAGEPTRVEIVTQAHIRTVNEQAFTVLIPALDLIDGHEHPTHLALTGSLFGGCVRAENIGNDLEADQLGFRRDATDGTQRVAALGNRLVGRFVTRLDAYNEIAFRIGGLPASGDDTGDMRSVAEAID